MKAIFEHKVELIAVVSMCLSEERTFQVGRASAVALGWVLNL